MPMMIAKTGFVHADIGAKRRRDLFWASEEHASQLIAADAAEIHEGKVIRQEYDTKVVRSSVSQAAQVQTDPTLNTAVQKVGQSGEQISSSPESRRSTRSMPATSSGGKSITPPPKGKSKNVGRRRNGRAHSTT